MVNVPMDAEKKFSLRKAVENSIWSIIKMTESSAESRQYALSVPPVFAVDMKKSKRLDPRRLHPVLFDKTALMNLGNGSLADRGTAFERLWMHSVFARYLLVRNAATTPSPWVPLSEVLYGALSQKSKDVARNVMVNLEKGILIPEGGSPQMHVDHVKF